MLRLGLGQKNNRQNWDGRHDAPLVVVGQVKTMRAILPTTITIGLDYG